MHRFVSLFMLSAVLFVFSSCKKNPTPPQAAKPWDEKTAQREPDQTIERQETSVQTSPKPSVYNEPISAYDLFVDKNQKSLSYKGYRIFKAFRKQDHTFENKHYTDEIPFSVLKKGKRIVKEFAWGDTSISASDFGLFNFTGGKSKQLIVAQTFPKGGRFWIVRLSPKYHLLLDTNDYGDFREDLGFLDIDKDGRYEMMEAIVDFENVKSVAQVKVPLPVIIFKYDRKADRYFPANHKFQKYALEGIEDDIKSLDSTIDNSDINRMESYYRKRVSILLKYVFAGKEKEGWTFFNQYYALPDKNKLKAAIKAVLRKQPAYRFIYSQLRGR